MNDPLCQMVYLVSAIYLQGHVMKCHTNTINGFYLIFYY